MTGGTDRREVLEVGPSSARSRWVLLGLVGVVVLMLIGFTLTSRGSDDLSTPPVPPPTPSPTPSSPSPSVDPSPTATRSAVSGPQVVRRGTGALAVGVPRGTIYVRTDDSLFAVEPATGRVVRTTGARLDSTGPVAMVPTVDGVVLRPLDTVPGVLVRDGRAPTELAGLLELSQGAIPGPDGRIWASRADRANSYTLVDGRGRPAGPTITATGWFRTDGGTGLLLEDVSGVWQAYPGRMRRVSIGAVVAVGPRHYLLTECDDAHRCADYLYDRATGRRRELGEATSLGSQYGVVSPAGTFSALLQSSTDGTFYIRVGRLRDGTVVRGFRGPVNGYSGTDQFAVWLSDRWLALVQSGRLVLFDADEGRLVDPRLPLSGAIQLAWRAG